MRIATLAIVAAFYCLVASSMASAASPIPGFYTTITNDFLDGRGSESWRNAPDNKSLDHVFNSESWDGSTLGTEWYTRCGVGSTTTTSSNLDSTGTGAVVYTTVYTGGVFWLSKNGPWGDGVNDLTGTLNTTTNITTVQYVNGIGVSAVSNVNTSGVFDGSGCSLTFAIANGSGKGDTDLFPTKPADYPDFLDTGCAAGNRDRGSWGDLLTITMEIDCPTPVESTTWGAVKARYR